MMLGRLVLLFTAVPLVELALLIRLGAWLGTAATIGLVLLTGVAGAAMARREGSRSWRAVQERLGAGRLPGDELLHAVAVLVAGILLVTPGVLTDGVGLLLLLRPARSLLVRRVKARLLKRLEDGTLQVSAWRSWERRGDPADRDSSGTWEPDGPWAGREEAAGAPPEETSEEGPDGWYRRECREAPGDGSGRP